MNKKNSFASFLKGEMSIKKTRKKSKIKLLHQYYNYTGFYSYIWQGLKKSFVPIVIVMIVLYFFNRYVLNINEFLTELTATFKPVQMLVFFFSSETILGLVPPEIFIAWAKKTATPLTYLIILAVLSYLGGLLGYWIGHWIQSNPKFHNFLENKMKEHLVNIRKWGGFLIMVGALLPLPFSMTCIAAGMVQFSFKNVILFGLLRFLRFAIYGAAIFMFVS